MTVAGNSSLNAITLEFSEEEDSFVSDMAGCRGY